MFVGHAGNCVRYACFAGGQAVGPQNVGELIHAYGRQFVHRNVQLALEYYMLAARAAGDALPVKGRLLLELLTESKAYGEASPQRLFILSHQRQMACQALHWQSPNQPATEVSILLLDQLTVDCRC